jgi:hypothetical protein
VEIASSNGIKIMGSLLSSNVVEDDPRGFVSRLVGRVYNNYDLISAQEDYSLIKAMLVWYVDK